MLYHRPHASQRRTPAHDARFLGRLTRVKKPYGMLFPKIKLIHHAVRKGLYPGIDEQHQLALERRGTRSSAPSRTTGCA